MKVYSIRKEFRFEAAHILDKGCNEACSSTIHGHSYVYTVELRCKNLDENGMVLDFHKLDELAGGAARNWDHAVLMSFRRHYSIFPIPGQQEGFRNLFITAQNPTAEWMSEEILEYVMMGLHNDVREAMGLLQVLVTVWETSKCSASCSWMKEV